jgi:hypothetical protein
VGALRGAIFITWPDKVNDIAADKDFSRMADVDGRPIADGRGTRPGPGRAQIPRSGRKAAEYWRQAVTQRLRNWQGP